MSTPANTQLSAEALEQIALKAYESQTDYPYSTGGIKAVVAAVLEAVQAAPVGKPGSYGLAVSPNREAIIVAVWRAWERQDGTCMGMNVYFASAIADEVIAALSVAPTTQPWLPIETAPKDGTVIDLWNNGDRYADAKWLRGEWCYLGLDGFDVMNWVPLGGRTTHWMPLPATPSEGGERG